LTTLQLITEEEKMTDENNDKCVAEYESMTGEKITLSKKIIKQYLVSGEADKVSDQEVMMFLSLCKFQKLNPFLREAYLIKYGTSPATIVTGKETFLKRAAKNPKYEGHQTGIDEAGKMAWAEVYVKGYRVPIRCEVDYDEYVGTKRDGSVTAMWKGKRRTMLKKVALVQALREAFPEDFGGMYSEEEVREEFNAVDAGVLLISPDQVEEINVLMLEKGTDPDLFKGYMKVESIEEIKAGDYGKAITAINLTNQGESE
jgi:phage recombination protein Bet